MQQHGIVLSHLTMTVGNEFFLEPAFYWQDEITPLHRKSLGDDVVGPWLDRPANLPARAAVSPCARASSRLPEPGRRQLADRPRYPLQQRAAGDLAADRAQARADPQGLMNPGSLGLRSAA
jgi:D-lactate dehydrogenase (cytochrome)